MKDNLKDLQQPNYEEEYERNCKKICELSMEIDKLKTYIFTLLDLISKELNK